MSERLCRVFFENGTVETRPANRVAFAKPEDIEDWNLTLTTRALGDHDFICINIDKVKFVQIYEGNFVNINPSSSSGHRPLRG